MPDRTFFDFEALSGRERYKLLIGTVVPRPIAWITTRSPEGKVNAAPYSFFGVLSADPAIVAVGIENRADMSFKDTALNIRLTEEFTVNIASSDLVDAMNVTAVAFPPGTDELKKAGLTAMPGRKVGCPYIAEAPAALECRRFMTIAVSKSREIVLGTVVAAHYKPHLVEAEKLYIDQLGIDALGRMGGHGYSKTQDQFDLPTPSLADWMAQAGE